MVGVWEQIGAMCAQAALPGGLFLAGLSGSAVHCGPMCGPFVLGQVGERMARLPANGLCEAARLRGALLLPYHAGRIATYAALGAVAGFAGIGLPGWAVALLLAAAASVFLMQALHRLRPAARPRGRLGAAIARLAGRIGRERWGGSFVLGMVLGLLPCGLLYGAILGAAASGGALAAAAAMVGFGLGTVPLLAAIGMAGAVAGRTALGGKRLGPAVMLLNATVLAVLAVQRVW